MDVVGGLVAAVDAVCAADPSTLADGESVVELTASCNGWRRY